MRAWRAAVGRAGRHIVVVWMDTMVFSLGKLTWMGALAACLSVHGEL
jgi:hypothetical protein